MRSTAVRAYLQIAPRWVWSLINCLLSAGMFTTFGWIDDPASEHPFRKVVLGLGMGVVIGAITGPMSARRQRGFAVVAGDLSNVDLLVARRASRRGPAPLNREIRLAAARLADSELDILDHRRGLRLIAGGAVTVIYIPFALTSSPWWWAFVVLFVGLLAAELWMPGHLRRRLTLLTADADADAG